MHHSYNDTHKKDAIGHMHIGYHHVLEKLFGAAKMAVHYVIGTVEERPIHAVYSIKSTMETSTEIAQMPHPTEQWRYIDITCAEPKDREHNGQNRTKKDGKLKKLISNIS